MRDTKQGAPGEPGSASDLSAPAMTARPGSDPTTPAGLSTAQGAERDDAGNARPVSTDMQQFIGRQLRAVFDDVAKQPVPDRFLELMRQLDGKTSAG